MNRFQFLQLDLFKFIVLLTLMLIGVMLAT